MPIRLGILEADVLYDDLIEDYQSYGRIFHKFFDQVKANNSFEAEFEVNYYLIQEGQYPQSHDECDVYLITGSKTGVYDDVPWLPSLTQWLQQAYQQGSRLMGICFGHQILAHALGGNAEKSDKGWGVGVRKVAMQSFPLWIPDCPSDFKLIYSHQDQVTELPENAKCLAGDDFCPNAAFYIDNQVVGFQGHPEFTPEYTQRLLGRRQDAIGEPTFSDAMKSLDEATDEEMIGLWLLEFMAYID